MSDPAQIDRLSRRIFGGAVALAIAVGLGGGLEVSAEHSWISATGGAALTLLLSSLACSPLASAVGRSVAGAAALAVALRRTRRWLGLAAAGTALAHALIGCGGYLGGIDVAAIARVPWLRHGGLALLVLGALSLTSFPVVTRALRVKAWSALHRFVYAAAVLAALHAVGTPFGDVGAGVFALAVVALLLLARPLIAVVSGHGGRPAS